MKKVSNRIKEARISAGLTLDDVAERAQTTRSTVWRIEDGRMQLTTSWIMRLAKAIGCAPGELLDNVMPEASTVEIRYYSEKDERVLQLEKNSFRGVALPLRSQSWVGAEIRSDDLWPRYARGDVVFFQQDASTTADPSLHVGKECVICSITGNLYIKKLMHGLREGSYRLVSYRSPDIDGIDIAWVSPILWVRRAEA